jgi:hypothetical protein
MEPNAGSCYNMLCNIYCLSAGVSSPISTIFSSANGWGALTTLTTMSSSAAVQIERHYKTGSTGSSRTSATGWRCNEMSSVRKARLPTLQDSAGRTARQLLHGVCVAKGSVQ